MVISFIAAAIETSFLLLRIGDDLGIELRCGQHLLVWRRLLLPCGIARVERILELLGEGVTVFTGASGKEMLLLVELGG